MGEESSLSPLGTDGCVELRAGGALAVPGEIASDGSDSRQCLGVLPRF